MGTVTLTWAYISPACANGVVKLTTYAGPQSVSPGGIIHVTVESVDARGLNADAQDISLSYISNGTLKVISGTPSHGLTSFDLPAQSSAGVMNIWAQTSNVRSNVSLVTVTAGHPQSFSIQAKSNNDGQGIQFTSNIISDEYGNPVSDLSLLNLNWIDKTGLNIRQSAFPVNGRLLFVTNCPSHFSPPLRVRFTISNTASELKDVTSLCYSEGE